MVDCKMRMVHDVGIKAYIFPHSLIIFSLLSLDTHLRVIKFLKVLDTHKVENFHIGL